MISKFISARFIYLLFGLFFSSQGYAQNIQQFKDKDAMFERRTDFSSLGNSMGLLENTKLLKDEEKKILQDFNNRIAAIKEKYKSEATNYLWQEFYEKKYQEGAKEAFTLDRYIENQIKDSKNANGTIKNLDPYTCTSHRVNKSTGEKQNFTSKYLSAINQSIIEIRTALYKIEFFLPKSTSTKMLMLTQKDQENINGKLVFCELSDGTENPDIKRKAQAIKSEKNVRERVPPYSTSRKSQDEMFCKTLNDSRIPSPPGVTCLFNYKQNQ